MASYPQSWPTRVAEASGYVPQGKTSHHKRMRANAMFCHAPPPRARAIGSWRTAAPNPSGISMQCCRHGNGNNPNTVTQGGCRTHPGGILVTQSTAAVDQRSNERCHSGASCIACGASSDTYCFPSRTHPGVGANCDGLRPRRPALHCATGHPIARV